MSTSPDVSILYYDLACNAPQVENVLFCVHRHFLVRDSVVFRDMLSVPTGENDKIPEGLSDDRPIVLHTVKSIDFERLLWMFYNKLSGFQSHPRVV